MQEPGSAQAIACGARVWQRTHPFRVLVARLMDTGAAQVQDNPFSLGFRVRRLGTSFVLLGDSLGSDRGCNSQHNQHPHCGNWVMLGERLLPPALVGATHGLLPRHTCARKAAAC